MGQFLSNTYRLGVKELWSLWRDRTMLVLIVYVFTLGVYTGATAMPETLHNAPIAVVDEDQSPLSQRIISALYPPQFSKPQLIENESKAMVVAIMTEYSFIGSLIKNNLTEYKKR